MRNELLYLSRSDVERVSMPPTEIVAAVHGALVEKGEGRAEMPPKPGIHPAPDSFLHAMPAYLPSNQAAGLKWVAGYPENKKHGLPYITGLLVLNDPRTGLPLCVMDATWITAMRTAAATALAARHLARRESKTLAILGCGVQGRSHTVVIPEELTSLERILAYDIEERNAVTYRDEMRGKVSVEIDVASSPEEAVRSADVIVTAGPILKKPQPALALGWLNSGAFVCTLDFDSYVQPAAFQGADKIACDDTAQFRYYQEIGYFGEVPDPYADLGELVTQRKPGREDMEERIICANLGLAIEDIAVGLHLYQLARKQGIGTSLPL